MFMRGVLMSISNIKSVGRRPLNIIVYENIKRAIIRGEIAPGTRLTETKVGKQMDVSTTPVREAFRRLESERLVKIIPWRGAIVQEFTNREISEVYQCREPLEVLAIQLAIDLIDEAGIKRLEELLDKSGATMDLAKHVEFNTKIHKTILEYAGNKTLATMLEELNDVISHYRHISTYSVQRKKEVYFEHTEIINALKDRDKQAAIKAVKAHISSGYNYIKDNMAENEQLDI